MFLHVFFISKDFIFIFYQNHIRLSVKEPAPASRSAKLPHPGAACLCKCRVVHPAALGLTYRRGTAGLAWGDRPPPLLFLRVVVFLFLAQSVLDTRRLDGCACVNTSFLCTISHLSLNSLPAIYISLNMGACHIGGFLFIGNIPPGPSFFCSFQDRPLPTPSPSFGASFPSFLLWDLLSPEFCAFFFLG